MKDRKIFKPLIIALIFCFGSTMLLAQPYYIDAPPPLGNGDDNNNGTTENTPWASFANANWDEDDIYKIKRGAVLTVTTMVDVNGNEITIQDYGDANDDPPELRPDGINYLFKVQDNYGVTFKNLTIDCIDGNYGFTFTGQNNRITIDNCNILNTAMGIYADDDTPVTPSLLTIKDSEFTIRSGWCSGLNVIDFSNVIIEDCTFDGSNYEVAIWCGEFMNYISNALYDSISLSNCNINTKTNPQSSSNYGLREKKVAYVTMNNCKISNTDYPIDMNISSNVDINNCEIAGAINGMRAIQVNDAISTLNCKFIDPVNGIKIDDFTTATNIHNCQIYSSDEETINIDKGIFIENNTTGATNGSISIVNCNIESCVEPIMINAGSSVEIISCDIGDIYSGINLNDGIYIENIPIINIKGNTVSRTKGADPGLQTCSGQNCININYNLTTPACSSIVISNNKLYREYGCLGSCIKYTNSSSGGLAEIHHNKCFAREGIWAYLEFDGFEEEIYNNYFEYVENTDSGAESYIGPTYGIITESTTADIHHNIIKNSEEYGIYVGTNTSADIYHNVIFRKDNPGFVTTLDFMALKILSTGSSESEVFFNIFYLNSLGGKFFNITSNVTTNVNAFNQYTMFDLFNYNSSPYENLSDYETSTPNGSKSFEYSTSDLPFADMEYDNFSLMPGSECVDPDIQGITLPTPYYSEDYSGNTIDPTASTPDIGAFEYPEQVPIDWTQNEPSGWFFATEEISQNFPEYKKGNIYHENDGLVYLRGVNLWAMGLDYDSPNTADFFLNQYDFASMIDLIQQQGFNCIRLAYTADVIKDYIENTSSALMVNVVANSGNSIFFDQGSPISKFDGLKAIVNYCNNLNPKMYVLLDHHGLDNYAGLWYDYVDWETEDYIETLEKMATEFNYSNIIGIDLINEPFAAKWNNSNENNNFKSFVEEASEAIHAINDDWLIFAEGIQYHNIPSLEAYEDDHNNLGYVTGPYKPHEQYGNAESMAAVKYFPLNPNKVPDHKVVFSPHCYHWKRDFIQGYNLSFDPTGSDRPLYKHNTSIFYDFRYGYLASDFAVVPGEFGARFHEPEYSHSKNWLGPYVEYMGERRMPGSFYWSMNGFDFVNLQRKGPQGNLMFTASGEPVLQYETDGNGDPVVQNGDTVYLKAYLGLLETDWTTIRQEKMDTLARLFGREYGVADGQNNLSLYSPRDGTKYIFPSSYLQNNDIIEHTAHWAGKGNGAQYANDVLIAMDYFGDLHDILHTFKITRNGVMNNPASGNFTITVTYTEDELGWVCENSLDFYKYNSGVWEPLTNCSTCTITPDPTNNEVILETSEFGIYAILGTEVAQRTDLGAGWNLWSTYIDPYEPELEKVMKRIATVGDENTNLTLMKDGDGLIFWPQYGLNTIGNHTVGEGYQIKMTSADFIRVRGDIVIPENTPIDIPQGWSLIGYLRKFPANIITMLSPIVIDISIVKDEEGLIYWPEYAINTIGNMNPGEGYQINMSNPVSPFYYASNSKSSILNQSNLLISYKNYSQELYINTDNNMTVGIPHESWGTPPQIGDEIAAFGENNQLVGKTIFNGGFTAITIYGDDYYTPVIVENLTDNESFTFEVWNPTNKSTNSYRFKNWEKGDGSFLKNELAIVAVDEETEEEPVFEIEVYPNPGKGLFLVNVLSSQYMAINLEIYDLNSKLVYSRKVSITNGNQCLKLDLTSLGAGTYTLNIAAKDFSKQTKIIIIN